MKLRSIQYHSDPQVTFFRRRNFSSFRWLPRTRDSIVLHCHHRWRSRRPLVVLRVRASLDDLFRDLISVFPSPTSLDLVFTPAIGLAAGASLYFSNLWNRTLEADAVVGDWVLFTSPTPFNRSVLLRCPSVSFEDGGVLLEGVNDMLLREERHYVNLSRGGIPVLRKQGETRPEEEIQYQRLCLRADDGGVISLDWPENLELRKEHGLDTTVLIVPGTPEGSMGRCVKAFVFDALQHGYFPIVMNPRGCAGSPLTTPRIFTAADSDDILTVIQFVSTVRPWTTMMSIGWGYGANMLTKYLADVGDSTVLTAAVCIDNTFDLDEATRSFPHHITLDQKLTSGLVNILQANKELFQGKAKGFDVRTALLAKSVRDFDQSISMVSHGYHKVEEFYSMANTRNSIGNLKIPVLFVQTDDGTVPSFSIPRGSIAENPFTSLILCSCLPSTINAAKNSATIWCQQLAIEWMSAVELALLKGRHPLLRDVDVPIRPSKASTFVDEETPERFSSSKNGHYDSRQLYIGQKTADRNTSGKLIQQNSVNELVTYPIDNALKQLHTKNLGDIKVNSHSRSELRKMESHHDQESTFEFKNDSEATITNEDDEASKVLQTAEVVMNMLDVTMPGTLNDEQKKKVISAVGRGENLMKALQGAVPEDVRGKITSAVTDIVQTHGTKLNFGGLGRIGWIPDITSKVKIQDTVKDISVNEREYAGRNSGADQEGRVPGDPAKLTSVSGMQENLELLEQRSSQSPGTPESGYEPSQNNYTEKTSYVVEGASDEQHKVSYSHGIIDRYTEDDKVPNDAHDIPNGEEKKPAQKEEQNMSVSASNSEQSLSSGISISDHQVIQQEVSEFQKNDEKGGPDLLQTSNGTAGPSVSVTQALDALTGFDDSTQMAVNSVFGVLEDMIDQLEKSSNEEDHEMKKAEGEGSQVISAGHFPIKSDNCEKIEEKDSGSSEKSVVTASNYKLTEVDIYPRKVLERNESMAGEGNTLQVDSSATKISKIDPLQKCPLDINRYYWGSPYEACLQMYFASQYPRPNPSDLNMTTDLFLDPEKGQWKMPDQATSLGSNQDEGWKIPTTINGRNENLHQSAKHSDKDDAIETSYVIVNPQDSKLKGQSTETIHIKGGLDAHKEVTLSLVRNSLFDALKVEVGRRLSISMLDEIEEVLVDDMKLVVDMVSQAVILNHHLNLKPLSEIGDLRLLKFGTLEGGSTVQIISSVVEETRYLKKVLPVGVIVGSLLASLRKYFVIAALDDKHKDYKKVGKVEDEHLSEEYARNELYDHEKDLAHVCSSSEDKMTKVNTNHDGAMFGAVTAALGATALLARQQQKTRDNENQVIEPPSSVNAEKGSQNVQPISPEELSQEKNPISIVSNLAEKAMSIAGPVVPTRDDGEVDHDRLVAVLAELGQKGGLLKLVGKIALLWGGLRGAMSLTDRLISYLRIAERPLLQRIFLFGCMVLLLWSPVVVPLLPTLVQSWTMKASNVIAEYACILGLYVSSMILVVLWGKRIRGYNNPLEQYGLDLTAPRVFGFMKGLVGGMVIVMSVHSIDGLLGFASLSWPAPTSFSATPVVLVKSFINVLLLSIRGILTATGVALVEELLFRSWLIKEVEVDLGYYPAIIISGIVFSLIHWSLPSVPGFFLLSLALFGIKQRS
ncbi:uncharacterized protein LOC121981545 isoform X1 [Zingiber officinale]|nr:uncharacterized protein LOC121981545 isoform X1 [Zingiber officinale]